MLVVARLMKRYRLGVKVMRTRRGSAESIIENSSAFESYSIADPAVVLTGKAMRRPVRPD